MARILFSLVLLLLLHRQSYGQTVTSAEYLASLTKPQFRPGHGLLHLSRYGYSISSNLIVELADWGYALEMGDGSNTDFNAAYANTNSLQWGLVRLATNNPSKYVLSIGVNQRFKTPIPDGFYVTNALGEYVGLYGTNTWTTNGGNRIISPEGDDDYWQELADYWVDPIAQFAAIAPMKVIYNAGEYGVNVFFGGTKEAWVLDPRVQAATNQAPWNTYTGGDQTNSYSWKLWFDYGSSRRAAQYQYTTDAIRALLPDRQVYIHYETDGESYRSLNLEGGAGWATGNHYNGYYMMSINDYPNFEQYYTHFNTGFTGSQDMLKKSLNAVGAHINYGYNTNYSWVSGGYTRAYITNDLANLDIYTGYLKCLYMAGMVGGISGYFSPFTDSTFDASSPPHWLRQLEIFGRVHAQFSWLDHYIFQGYLLPGSTAHAMSTDQPSYEFTNTVADASVRVLSRKLTSSDDWLICAWAADGDARSVTVNIPTLGATTLTARNTGSLYRATATNNVRLLNELGQPAARKLRARVATP